MPKLYDDIEHYDNLGEFYLKIVKPRIEDGEDITNELNKHGEGSLSRFYASFNWRDQKYNVRGDTTLEAIQEGYLQYLQKGDEAFYSYDSNPTVIALRCFTKIKNFYIYVYKKKVKQDILSV